MDWSPMTSPAATDRPAAPATGVSQRRLIVGICVTVVAIAFEAIAVATAMPIAAQDLNGLPYYAWSFSLFLIGMLVATVVAGRVSDRIGPAKPLLVGLVVFSAGLVLSGTSLHMVQLIGGRLVQGLGSGVINVAIFVAVAKVFEPRLRPRVFTYISTAWVVPSFVGPPIAAWLTHNLSWHWVFFAVLPLVVVGAAMITPSLIPMMRGHEPPATSGKPQSMLAAGLVAIGAAALQAAGQRLDWIALVLVAVGIALLLVGLPRLMPPGFMRMRRGLSAVILVRGLLPGAFFGGEAFIPLMLVEERGIALVIAGAALTVGAVGWTTGSWLQSQTWLRVRRDRLITLGCASVALGLAVVAATAALPDLWFGVVGLGWIFSGLGMGLAISSTSVAVMSLSAEGEQGRNASSLNLFDALGSGIFVGLAGTVFAALHPTGNLPLTFGVLLGGMSAVACLSVLASLRIGEIRSGTS
ncbi:MFS transporter [Microlunatus ginsengisoli]|uniref:MFS transporter n=1 Tax=Microlunatus ginsengisoli TaxID=363863 RepID=A0ABP6ZF35_9ACTN